MHNEQIIHEINKKEKVLKLFMERRININWNQSFCCICVSLNVCLCYTHLMGEQQAAQSMERSSVINLRLDCLSARCLYKTTNSQAGEGGL